MSSLAACNGVRNDWWREWRGECNREKGEINDADLYLARFKYRITCVLHFPPDTTLPVVCYERNLAMLNQSNIYGLTF